MSPGIISCKFARMNSLFSPWSATLVIILTAAWFIGKSPVLMIGFRTRVTMSEGNTAAIAVAQASAARSTWHKIIEFDFHISY